MLSAAESFTGKTAAQEAERVARMATPWALAMNATDTESRQIAARWLLVNLYSSLWHLCVASEIDAMGAELQMFDPLETPEPGPAQGSESDSALTLLA